MATLQKFSHLKCKGAVLIISMVFILIFSTLAVSMAAMSGTNVKLASNQQQVNRALCCAHSGMEIIRYYLNNITVSGSVDPEDRLQTIANDLQNVFTTAGMTNMSVSYDVDSLSLTIPNVTLDAQTNQRFTVTLTFGVDFDTVNVVVTGNAQEVSKQVAVNYGFSTVGNPIFDYGIATKGPLSMQGNVDVDGYNENIEASVYIESSSDFLALEMTGKSSIAGEVSIGNPNAFVDIANSSSVHGETGEDALEHVTIGLDDIPDFPEPNPTEFVGYIQNTFQVGDPTSNVTLTNVEIPANTPIELQVLDAELNPLAVKEVTIILANPPAGIEPMRRSATAVGPLNWRVEGLRIPVAGAWMVRVDLLISDFEKIVLEDRVELPRLP